jgi:Uma2 family endonuclease
MLATATPPQTKVMTADELIRLPMGMGERYELVEGVLKTMAPAGFEHGDIASELNAQLRNYVRSHKLGKVLAAETGFRLRQNPDTVRAPDVAFVSQIRLHQIGKSLGFFPGAPDLAVEVVSPNDASEETLDKIYEYFEAGTKLVWIVYPRHREVHVYTSPRQNQVLTVDDTLDGGDVIPGFRCPVRVLFE